jgi:hemerythrin-like domain-containing protein
MILHPTPAASFDQPFDMLAACHDRVRRSLALLSRLVAHVAAHGADAQARSAAQDVLRYFDLAAPHHHEDEERHVIPRLLASGDAALVAAGERMRADHLDMHAAWQVLRPLLETLDITTLGALRDAAQRFAALYEPHLALEDELAFPAAHRQIDNEGAAALAAMGQDMAQRRGVVR